MKKYTIDKERLPKSLIFAGLLTFVICSLMAICLLLYIPIQKKIVGKAYIYPSGLNMPIKAETSGKIHYQISSDAQLSTDQIIATIDWDISEEIINQLERLYTLELDRYASSVLDQIKELCTNLRGVHIYQLSDKIEALSGTIDLYFKRQNVANREELINQYQVSIEQQKAYQEVLRNKEVLVRKRRDLLLTQAASDSTLFKIGAISIRDLEAQATDILRTNEELIVIEQELSDVSREISKINQELIDVKTNYSIRLNDYQLEILGALNEYKTTYLRESEKRIIRAPGSGKIFIDQIAINQSYINEGEVIAQLINYTNQGNDVVRTGREKKLPCTGTIYHLTFTQTYISSYASCIHVPHQPHCSLPW